MIDGELLSKTEKQQEEGKKKNQQEGGEKNWQEGKTQEKEL